MYEYHQSYFNQTMATYIMCTYTGMEQLLLSSHKHKTCPCMLCEHSYFIILLEILFVSVATVTQPLLSDSLVPKGPVLPAFKTVTF